MTRFIIPIILCAAAIGLFVVYTNPQYQGLKVLQAKAAEYNDALSKASQLRSIRDQLLSKRNTFSQEDISRLQHALPDNVDNIRLIIDINNIAARHSLSLTNIGVGTVSDSSAPRNSLAVGSSGDAVGSVTVNFSLNADYDTFLAFLHDLEHSLRIVDVESIDLSVNGTGGLAQYDVTIRTYWLH
ncbi:MAG: type 4a pilus biogenesis protein PilO [Patescibacteria group bacterium]